MVWLVFLTCRGDGPCPKIHFGYRVVLFKYWLFGTFPFEFSLLTISTGFAFMIYENLIVCIDTNGCQKVFGQSVIMTLTWQANIIQALHNYYSVALFILFYRQKGQWPTCTNYLPVRHCVFNRHVSPCQSTAISGSNCQFNQFESFYIRPVCTPFHPQWHNYCFGCHRFFSMKIQWLDCQIAKFDMNLVCCKLSSP